MPVGLMPSTVYSKAFCVDYALAQDNAMQCGMLFVHVTLSYFISNTLIIMSVGTNCLVFFLV